MELSFMKVIIATDSFKGTLTAYEACEIIAIGICESAPTAQLVIKPMADGGERIPISVSPHLVFLARIFHLIFRFFSLQKTKRML